MKALILILLLAGTCVLAQSPAAADDASLSFRPASVASASDNASGGSNTLYVVQTTTQTREVTKAEFDKLDLKELKMLQILTGDEAERRFGKKGANGAMVAIMNAKGDKLEIPSASEGFLRRKREP